VSLAFWRLSFWCLVTIAKLQQKAKAVITLSEEGRTNGDGWLKEFQEFQEFREFASSGVAGVFRAKEGQVKSRKLFKASKRFFPARTFHPRDVEYGVWGVTEHWMQLRLIVRWSAQRPEFATDHGFRYHKGVAAQHIDVFMNEWR